ncbi:MAG: hypothetical protein Q4D26_07655 [Clostridia bacterium]|nr:hypothetical protein [Clostridia bacterium]
MNNRINTVKSPLSDSIESAYAGMTSVCGNLAEALDTVESIKPKSFGIAESICNTVGSFGEVNILPCYKVTCNLHSVNSAKILYLY